MSDVDRILSIGLRELQKQQQQQDPTCGVNGHLYYLLDALAMCLLTEEQQAVVQQILDLHARCAYAFIVSDTGSV